jgi:hypothetical protein
MRPPSPRPCPKQRGRSDAGADSGADSGSRPASPKRGQGTGEPRKCLARISRVSVLNS